MLAVSERENNLNIKFNMIASSWGMRNTKWGRLTIQMFALFAIGTSFICF